ncbi:MAG: coproporphyrinogen III oxidase, partial [Candidatus Nealsonbacteria bacterium CG10_big_fil_rev_8_21_14_0_10_37_25]
MECNPFTTTFRKLKILEHFGINRISFGVQSTNEKILKSMNRGYQSFDLIKRTINNAKKCKFKRINVDLM